MTAVEITLIIVGIVFLLVSFLVQEKLSPKDIMSGAANIMQSATPSQNAAKI